MRSRLASLAETAPFHKSSSGGHEQFGPYVIHERLGEGGMAYVDRAEMLGRDGFRKTVALKRMRTEWTTDPDFIHAFVHEAQLASRLSHPNIAQAYDLGKIDGTYFIAMELVQGPTLSQITQQARRAAGPVPLAIALEILIQLCDALDHAHELCDAGGRPLDLVHRDISPSNVIVSRDGIAKLIDFGIAKARSARRSTQAGIIKGKHAYVAPEYTYGRLDRRADIWGLGVIAHELLAGRRLFVGENDAATIRNVRNQPIPAPSKYARGVSQDLDDIVMTALQRDPDQRFQNAGAMRVALTTEVRRLRMATSGAQIRDWVSWAFEQVPRSEDTVNEVIDAMPTPIISFCSPIALERAPTIDVTPPRRRTTPKALPVVKPRQARWNPPARWTKPPRRSSASPFVLLAVIAFAAFAVVNGWIDIEAWRALLA
ncbi:MAG: serine/threonine protein kinase [Myxococcota bacterium]|nr:serine/threonine protein kinase [Myxococcota bacterium]